MGKYEITFGSQATTCKSACNASPQTLASDDDLRWWYLHFCSSCYGTSLEEFPSRTRQLTISLTLRKPIPYSPSIRNESPFAGINIRRITESAEKGHKQR